jgi:outer membrane lipase/esterase
VVSDWVFSSLSGASAISSLAEIPAGRLGAQWRAIDDRVRNHAVSGGKSGFFVQGDYAPSKLDSTATTPSAKGNGKTGTVGFDRAFGNGLVGVALGYSEQDFSLGGVGGKIEYDELIGSVFGAWRLGAAYLDSSFSYARHDYNVRRNSALGPFTATDNGTTEASQWGFRVGGGYNFGSGAVKHGPVAGLAWEQVKVDGFTETASATAMTFSSVTRKSLKHRLGYQVVGEVPTGWIKLKPYVRVTHEKEYKNNGGPITAGLAGSGFAFSTATRATKDSWGLIAVGTAMEFKEVTANVGFTSTFSQSGARNSSLSLGLSVPF